MSKSKIKNKYEDFKFCSNLRSILETTKSVDIEQICDNQLRLFELVCELRKEINELKKKKK